jgi:hypothetical protein
MTPEIKLQPDELSEVKINLLQTWGDLEHVLKYSDRPTVVEALANCAENHIDYLYCLVTGEHLHEGTGKGTVRQSH